MLNAKGKNTSRFFSIFAWLERETSSREECNKRSLFLFHLGSDRIPNLFTCHCSSKHKNFSRLVLGAGWKEKRTRHPGNEIAINCVEKCEEQMRKTDKKKTSYTCFLHGSISGHRFFTTFCRTKASLKRPGLVE